jgi:hypothetical protein
VKKPTRKSRALNTLAEFAAALDTPLSTVSGWTKHALWKWNKKAPWAREIIPDVLNWAADELERGRPSTQTEADVSTTKGLRDEKLRQEIRKLRANADQAVTALMRERGNLHDADECEEERTRMASLIRNAFQNVAPQAVVAALSAGMPHDAAPTFQKQIDELVNGCLRYLAITPDAQPETGDAAGAKSARAA